MNTSDDSTFTLLTGLSPFAEYSVRVRAFTVEFGNFSSEQRLMTTEDGRWKLDARPHALYMRTCMHPHNPPPPFTTLIIPEYLLLDLCNSVYLSKF